MTTIKDEIKDLRARLDKLEREASGEGEVWKPVYGELYYISLANGAVVQDEAECDYDLGVYYQGRAFPTQEAAELFQKRERTLADMRRIAEKHGGEPAPGKEHIRVYCNVGGRKWVAGLGVFSFSPGAVRFPTKEAAQEAIDTLDLDVFWRTEG